MEKLSETGAGRMQIQAATDRLDRTVAELGERVLAQGEKEVVTQEAVPPMMSQPLLVPFQDISGNVPGAMDDEPRWTHDGNVQGEALSAHGSDHGDADEDMEVSAVGATRGTPSIGE